MDARTLAAAFAATVALTTAGPAGASRSVAVERLPHASITGFTQLEGIARIGDVNGDHRADLAIGDFNTVHVVFGPKHGWRGSIDVRRPGRWGFDIRGAAGSDAGDFIDGAGDFNGDGLRDILVASLFVYPDEFGGEFDPLQRPEVDVVFGKRGNAPVDLARPNGRARVISLIGRQSAGGVHGAGDVNGDGYDDVIIGQYSGDAKDPPGAYVVFGGKGATRIDLLARSWPGFQILTPTAHEWVWQDVEAAGDQNGDGLADVVVGPAGGEPLDVVFGKRTRAVVDTARLGRHGFTIAPPVELAWQAGDVNGDGRADLLGFAPVDFRGRKHAGAAFTLFGRPKPRAVDMTRLRRGVLTVGGRIGEKGCHSAPEGTFTECDVESEGLTYGTSVGDLDGDGRGDLALVAARTMRLYVIHGRTGGTIDSANLEGRDYVIVADRNDAMYGRVAWVGGRYLAAAGTRRRTPVVWVTRLAR